MLNKIAPAATAYKKRLRSSSSSTSPAPSPRAPPISHKKKSCYLGGSLALYEPVKEQILRQYEAGKSLASRSQRSHDIGSKKDQWGSSDGTVANIMFRLSISKNSYRQVQKILRDFVRPEEK